MYGKIFDSIYDGTLAEDWRALITFQQMVVLCDADGVVDMTPIAISRRTGIPIEHIKAGIEILEAADPYSRTPGEEGRRILRLEEHRPWGWQIVNHAKYRNLQDYDTVRSQNRERKRRQREREKGVTDGHAESRDVTDGHAESRYTNTNTEDPPTSNEVGGVDGKPSTPPCPHAKIIALYHEALPELRQVRVWNDQRRKLLTARWRESKERQSLDWWRSFFEYVRGCDWLMGRVGDGRNWQADLEWLVRPQNFAKVVEGKYESTAA